MPKPIVVHIVQMLCTGGAEKMLVDLAIKSSDKYATVIICLYAEKNLPLVEKAAVNGIRLIFLDKRKGFHPRTFFDLWKTLSKLQPAVVHTHLEAAIYAMPWNFFHRRVVRVHTIHSVPAKEFSFWHRFFQKIAYKFGGTIPVAISAKIRQEVAQLYKTDEKNISLIYNGIDTKVFYQVRREFAETVTIINVASFQPWKNQILLVEAFKIACRTRDNLRLLLVGEGSEKKVVEQKVKEAGLQSKITFVGYTKDVNSYLNKAEIFVLCSDFEGFPLAVIEAMAAGLPIISTDVGGVAEIVEDGVNGILVPPAAPEVLAKAILILSENPQRRDQIAELNVRKAAKFGLQASAEAYLKLYAENLSAKT